MTSTSATLINLLASDSAIDGACRTIYLDISDHFAVMACLPTILPHPAGGQRRPNKLNFNAHGRHLSNLFLYKAGNLWNCLPPSITKLASLAEFRDALTQVLQAVCL